MRLINISQPHVGHRFPPIVCWVRMVGWKLGIQPPRLDALISRRIAKKSVQYRSLRTGPLTNSKSLRAMTLGNLLTWAHSDLRAPLAYRLILRTCSHR